MYIFLVFLLYISSVLCGSLREEFTWTRISYVPRDPSHGSKHMNNEGYVRIPTSASEEPNRNDYIFENNIPMGAHRWQNKLFVTVPRRRLGVPSTLNYIWTNSTQKHNVPLIPYPDWETNQLPTPSDNGEVRLVSAYRLAVDPCNRLWMVDTGLLELPGNFTQVQQPSIVIFDLLTNRVIQKYELKPTDLSPLSSLAAITVDVTANSCQDAYAYIPDLGGYGVIVFSLKENNSWRVSHNYFYLESQNGIFHVGGQDFTWNDGIFSIALSAVNTDGHRTAYFHSMAGIHIYSVSTRILNNQQLATRSYHDDDFKIEVNRGPNAQTSTADIDQNTGIMFLSLVNQNAVGCWNTHQGARPENFDVIQREDNKMIYPSDLKISDNDVIVFTTTMPAFLYSNLNYDEINFRIWIANITEAVRGTTCATSGTGRSRNTGYSRRRY